MPFEVPQPPLNIAEHAANSVIRFNQRVDSDVAAFIADYEHFWGVSGSMVTDPETQEQTFVPAVGRYTVEQMQEKINLMPQSSAKGLLTLAGLKRDMILTAETELSESFLPERYHEAAFTYEPMLTRSDPIVLTGLAEAWTPPADE